MPAPFSLHAMLILLALIQVVSERPAVDLADGIGRGRRFVQFPLEAVIPQVCTIEAAEADIRLDVNSRGLQTATTVTYMCNDPSGLTRTLTSENGGSLKREGQEIPYYVAQSAPAGLAIGRTRLSAPLITPVAGSETLTKGTAGTLSVEIPNLAPDLLAGDYRDTVTITITPN